jgi:hypothetical protein
MSGEKGSAYANDLLKYVFNAIRPSWDQATNLYVSLHTGDPTASGNQTSNEISYTGYARVAVNTATGWTVSGNTAAPASNITFPGSTGGVGGVVTYAGIGTSASGAGELMYAGPVSPSITVANGVTPQITTALTLVTES